MIRVGEVGTASRRLQGWLSVPPSSVERGVGACLVVVAVSQVTVDPEPAVVQWLEVGLPVVLTIPLFYVSFAMRDPQRQTGGQPWVAYLSLLFAAIAVSTLHLLVVTQTPAGHADLLFEVAIGTTAGAAIGSPMGLVYERLQSSKAELEREVTEKRRLNQQLSVVNRVLRHNVRNRLSVALGQLDSLADAVGEAGVDARVRKCRAALESLLAHAEKAMHVRELQENPDARTTEDVAALVDAAVAALDTADVDIHLSVPDEARVRAHPLVETAVAEAIENAVEYAADAPITVSVRERGDEVEVEVADLGQGVPPSERRALSLAAETQLHHGSGLGLWLVKWIVEASDGSFELGENTPSGSRLQLSLPASKSPGV